MRGVLVIIFILFAALPAHAQFGLTADEAGLSLEVSPLYPEPRASVTARIHSTLYDLSERNIVWRVGDDIVQEGIGGRTITFKVGGAGEARELSAEVEIAGSPLSTSITLVPSSVDLLWESDSYTPPLYEGRAQPSAGSVVRLYAIPHLALTDGTEVQSDAITYTWRRGGEVMGELSGRGRSSIIVTAPLLFGSETYSVEAQSADRTRGASVSVRVTTRSPELRLYEHHPLFGVLYHHAIAATAAFDPTETRFSVVPYFAPTDSPSQNGLVYEWDINQTRIEIDPDRQDELTIDARASTGAAFLELTLTQTGNYFLQAKAAWRISFGGTRGVPGAFDPFRSSDTQ
ncbi:MAG TPA: hypothetical protein VJL39_02355 [Candidatus Paceibacterota bacterium]